MTIDIGSVKCSLIYSTMCFPFSLFSCITTTHLNFYCFIFCVIYYTQVSFIRLSSILHFSCFIIYRLFLRFFKSVMFHWIFWVTNITYKCIPLTPFSTDILFMHHTFIYIFLIILKSLSLCLSFVSIRFQRIFARLNCSVGK